MPIEASTIVLLWHDRIMIVLYTVQHLGEVHRFEHRLSRVITTPLRYRSSSSSSFSNKAPQPWYISNMIMHDDAFHSWWCCIQLYNKSRQHEIPFKYTNDIITTLTQSSSKQAKQSCWWCKHVQYHSASSSSFSADVSRRQAVMMIYIRRYP